MPCAVGGSGSFEVGGTVKTRLTLVVFYLLVFSSATLATVTVVQFVRHWKPALVALCDCGQICTMKDHCKIENCTGRR